MAGNLNNIVPQNGIIIADDTNPAEKWIEVRKLVKSSGENSEMDESLDLIAQM